jgi:hypothetical protein
MMTITTIQLTRKCPSLFVGNVGVHIIVILGDLQRFVHGLQREVQEQRLLGIMGVDDIPHSLLKHVLHAKSTQMRNIH